jgi:hypothetical protein
MDSSFDQDNECVMLALELFNSFESKGLAGQRMKRMLVLHAWCDGNDEICVCLFCAGAKLGAVEKMKHG